jgi:hypothetical protein
MNPRIEQNLIDCNECGSTGLTGPNDVCGRCGGLGKYYMEPLDLDGIKARADAASPGPWQAHNAQIKGIWAGRKMIGSTGTLANSQFVAEARTDIPKLLALVAAQEAELVTLRAKVAE